MSPYLLLLLPPACYVAWRCWQALCFAWAVILDAGDEERQERYEAGGGR